MQRPVHGHLALAGVDAELRPDRHGPGAVAAGDEIALHLHVLEHLGVRPVVRREQGLEDLLALVGELPLEDPPVRRLARPLAREAREQEALGGMRKSG